MMKMEILLGSIIGSFTRQLYLTAISALQDEIIRNDQQDKAFQKLQIQLSEQMKLIQEMKTTIDQISKQ